jgi:hypothetical protein
MTDTLTNDTLKKTLGMAVSVIATEHFMSAGLSSPWSVAKFAISDEDKQQVWHYFNEAVYASAVFSVITSYMLKSWFPIISSALTLGYYKKLYADALSRTPTVNPTPVLSPPQLTVNDNGTYEPMTTGQLDQIRKFLDS